MKVDILIIGQGICGTFLEHFARAAGLSCVVIDEDRPFTASRVAAGLINPVTGRRIVKTWMIDELLPFVVEAYDAVLGGGGALGAALEGGWLTPVGVVDLFPTVQMRLAFLKRIEEGGEYLSLPSDERMFASAFSYDLGYGVIAPCYLVNLPSLLAASRRDMIVRGVLREERFVLGEMRVMEDGVQYRDVEARWVVFCDGVASFESPYFSRLPFAPNKGEALIISAPELAGVLAEMSPAGGLLAGVDGYVFKKGMSLAPWGEGLYWVGSSYEWEFASVGPTEAFRQRTEAVLGEWLRVPFTTVEHVASVRPATLERRPFVGVHPLYPAVGILNGMGTKGCSLAPFFARQLVDFFATGKAVQADADVGRFRRILQR